MPGLNTVFINTVVCANTSTKCASYYPIIATSDVPGKMSNVTLPKNLLVYGVVCCQVGLVLLSLMNLGITLRDDEFLAKR